MELNFQYVTDSQGRKTAVILPIKDFNELVADLHDLAVLADRRQSTTNLDDHLNATVETSDS